MSETDIAIAPSIEETVLPLMYSEPDNVHAIGSAFVINASERFALLATAKHNFQHIHQMQNPHPRHNPSTPDVFRMPQDTTIRLDTSAIRLPIPRTIREGKPVVAHVIGGIASANTDIGFLLAAIPEDADFVFRSQLGFDPSPLQPGEELIAFGTVSTVQRESSGEAQTLHIRHELAVRTGHVLGRSSAGHRIAKWPVAQTNIPFSSGMSGGPVISASKAEIAGVARGVICSDISENPDDMRQGSGASLVSELWPSLMVSLDILHELSGRQGPTTILDMIDLGLIRYGNNSLEQFHAFSALDRTVWLAWGNPGELLTAESPRPF